MHCNYHLIHCALMHWALGSDSHNQVRLLTVCALTQESTAAAGLAEDWKPCDPIKAATDGLLSCEQWEGDLLWLPAQWWAAL